MSFSKPSGFRPIGPKAGGLWGNAGRVLALHRDRLSFFTRLAREYGDFVFCQIGPEQVYLINRPDWIEEILVTRSTNFQKGVGLQISKRILGEGLLTSEGEFHLRQRRLAQPAFHRARIAAYGEAMLDYAQRTSDRWQDSWRESPTRDIHEDMMRLTLGIVGKTLFDADVESEAAEIGEALATAMKLFEGLSMPMAELFAGFPWIGGSNFQRAKDRLDATVYRMIAEHRATPDRGDLLSMLLLAQDAESDGGRMSDLQLRDEAMTIFLAGHETTANALTWTWYLLSQNPEEESRLHAEIDTGKTFPDLPYTRAVLAESMRLYPPAWILGRRVMADFPMNGYTVPAGALVLLSQWIMHRDARYFPDPERFDPSRWLSDAPERPKFAYFPFGGGPRLCIGESFAWMEGVLVLATLARHWRLRLVPGHPVNPKPLVTLRPEHGMRMTLDRR